MFTKNEVKEEKTRNDIKQVESSTQKSMPSIWYT